MPDGIADLLALPKDGTERAHEIVRLRLADGERITLETNYVPTRNMPSLEAADASSSLYAILSERLGISPESAQETYESIALDPRQAKLLGRAQGSPAFRVTRVTFDTSDFPFECTVVVAPGDRTRYHLSMRRNQASIARLA